jgi:hypothetical protein
VEKIVKNLIKQENGKNYIETTHKRNERQQELIKKKKKKTQRLLNYLASKYFGFEGT